MCTAQTPPSASNMVTVAEGEVWNRLLGRRRHAKQNEFFDVGNGGHLLGKAMRTCPRTQDRMYLFNSDSSSSVRSLHRCEASRSANSGYKTEHILSHTHTNTQRYTRIQHTANNKPQHTCTHAQGTPQHTCTHAHGTRHTARALYTRAHMHTKAQPRIQRPLTH